jgi:hypothetical protein
LQELKGGKAYAKVSKCSLTLFEVHNVVIASYGFLIATQAWLILSSAH